MTSATTGRDAVEARIERAACTCTASGARLTDIRCRVLALILRSEEPVSAYVLLDH